MSHVEQFRAAIEAAGLVPPAVIHDDGKRRRFSSNGVKGDDSGWYILHGDERPAGAFGCWRGGMSITWKSSEHREFTAEEKAAWRKRMEQLEAERAEEQRKQVERAASVAADIWERASAGDHPYLQRKRIPCLTARVLDGDLLVSMRHGPGAYVGMQRIQADGEKKFLYGTPAEGSYHVIGNPRGAVQVYICEGFATGASIHMATDCCVVVAFNAGNLLSVAKKIRAAMPNVELILCADDDAWTVRPANHPKAGDPWNVGIEAAMMAAVEVGGTVRLPRWEGERIKGHTDFNDLHCDEGLDAVKSCLQGDGHSLHDKPASVVDNAGSVESVAPSDVEAVQGQGSVITVPSDDSARMIWASKPLETAKQFQDWLPEDAKVLHWRGDFFIWNGSRYEVRDPLGIQQSLYHFMASCVTEKLNKNGDAFVVAFDPKRTHVEDVMHALRAVCFVDFPEPPHWITPAAGDPPPSELVAFRNGFLHLPTKTLLPSTPRLFVTSALEFDYNPNAPKPVEWMNFLHGLWGNDPQSIEALSDMFGYLLTEDTSQQKMFMMIGPPRSGKGTILRVLESCVGLSNRVSPSLGSLGNQFGIEPLIGKRVAMVSDARLSGKADQQAIVENLLRISGEDTLTLDRKNKTAWSGKLPTRFVFASNETPAFQDASSALPNRFIMFKFDTSFLGREDTGLTSRLLKELPGIVLWALEGLSRLHKRGYLVTPASGEELHAEMRAQSSPISVFLEERCVMDGRGSIERGDLYKAWRKWCEDQGIDHPGTLSSFGRKLTAALPAIGRSQPRDGGIRANVYTGLRLKGIYESEPL